MPTGDILSTTEAAAILGVSRDTVKSWIYKGKLPAVKIGREWVIRRGDLDKAPAKSKAGKPRKQA